MNFAHATTQLRRKQLWRERFARSVIIRLLPLLLFLGASTLLAVWKMRPVKTNVTVLSVVQVDRFCSTLCDSLLTCQADFLKDQDRATVSMIRSACITGCGKQQNRLSACEALLEKGPARTQEECSAVSACYR